MTSIYGQRYLWTEVPKSLQSMRICMILATGRNLVVTPDLTTRIVVMEVRYFCTKNVVRKFPEESLHFAFCQSDSTWSHISETFDAHFRKSSSYYWPRSGGGRKGAAIRASMLTEALKPVNLNLLIGVERVRSESEEPRNSSESLLTTKRPGREFYWHWLWRRGGQCFCAHETIMSMIRPTRLRGVRTNKSDCRFPAGRDERCEVVRRSQSYTCKLATCKCWDSVKGANHRSEHLWK